VTYSNGPPTEFMCGSFLVIFDRLSDVCYIIHVNSLLIDYIVCDISLMTAHGKKVCMLLQLIGSKTLICLLRLAAFA
jgi:hypothetical protein